MSCYMTIPLHVSILYNNRSHIHKDLISSYIPLCYVMDMVGHLIIIIMSASLSKGMQHISDIYINWDVLLLTKLSYHTIWAM
jgi:hypothetical protein